MKTVFVVLERSRNNGVIISKIFSTRWEAAEYEYDAESVSYQAKAGYEYWTEEWEVS